MAERPRIILVDDSLDSILALAALLKRKGYNVDWATSGESALALMEDRVCGVLITDWRMPGLNGVELAAAVKDRYPDTKVIVVSAYAQQYRARGGGKQWVDYFMPKPLDPDKLLNTIQSLIPSSSGSAALSPPYGARDRQDQQTGTA